MVSDGRTRSRTSNDLFRPRSIPTGTDGSPYADELDRYLDRLFDDACAVDRNADVERGRN